MGSAVGESQINPPLERLLSVFERMRERPRRRDGDQLRPLLLTIGPEHVSRQVLHTFVERCQQENGPHSHLDGDVPDTDIARVLRHVGRELSRDHPRLEPALRLPLLSMALWLLDLRRIRLRQAAEEPVPQLSSHADRQNRRLAAELTEAHEDRARRTLLGRGIRRREQLATPGNDEDEGDRGRIAAALAYMEHIAPIGVALVALLSATAASTVDLAAAMLAGGIGLAFVGREVARRVRDRAGQVRYRWFTRQTYVQGHRSSDFLGFALDVFNRPFREGEPDEPLDLLLVAAFLEDLRQAYRRGRRRAAWARVVYPAVVIDVFPEGHISRRFLRLLEQVRRDGETFDPLVVAAGFATQAEASALSRSVQVPLASLAVADLTDVADVWSDHLADRRRAATFGTRREIRVDVASGDGSGTEPVHRPRRRPWPAHPALPWIVMGALFAASLTVIGVQTVRYCEPDSVWHAANGECVGVTDGSYVFNNRLSGVEGRIRTLNDHVVGSGKPYVTIVYLGAMSVDPAAKNPQDDLLAGAHGELVGLSIAQEERNRTNEAPLLRVLLANSGSKVRYAKEVAERIRAQSSHDRTIVAVVGFGQSKQQTQDAIDELSKAALPMVGTTNTYDDTARSRNGFSPYYFRLAPPNRRLAEHAAYWATHGRLAGLKVTSADVFYDASKDELYSGNLAKDFQAAFTAGGVNRVRMLSYTDPSQIPGEVQEACQRPSQIFYYTGRSDEFRSFLNELDSTSCGGRPRVVLAGDEVTKYVSDNRMEIGRNHSVRLYYTPLASEGAWGDQPHPFFTDFDPVVDGLLGKNAPQNERPSRIYAAMAYDAALTIIKVADRVYDDQGRALPTTAAVLSELTEPGAGAPPEGASGLLRFGARDGGARPYDGGHQVPDKPVLLQTVQPDGAESLLVMCGQLIEQAPQTTNCPRRS
jgi:ABC-type branched-subunit amino acid transport system substrate-binding protein